MLFAAGRNETFIILRLAALEMIDAAGRDKLMAVRIILINKRECNLSLHFLEVIYTFTCIYTHAHMCTHTHKHTHKHTHTYTHTHTHTYVVTSYPSGAEFT